MEYYEDVLEHIVEPSDPQEREAATSVLLTDYEALFLADVLREWGTYHAEGTEQHIALGYVEYIERAIKEYDDNIVHLYAHTTTAGEVPITAYTHLDRDDDVLLDVETKAMNLSVEAYDG